MHQQADAEAANHQVENRGNDTHCQVLCHEQVILGAHVLVRVGSFDGAPNTLVTELDDSEHANCSCVEDKQNEHLHVVHADAVGHPATVVVHADDAAAARAAVVGSWRLDTVVVVADVEEFVLEVVDLIVAQRDGRVGCRLLFFQKKHVDFLLGLLSEFVCCQLQRICI